MTTTDQCQTCHKTHPWPDGTTPRHPFNDGTLRGIEVRGIPDPEPVGEAATQAWPFDPVLRQALIDKGVLTVQDLRDAEDKIRVVTSTFEGRSNAPH